MLVCPISFSGCSPTRSAAKYAHFQKNSSSPLHVSIKVNKVSRSHKIYSQLLTQLVWNCLNAIVKHINHRSLFVWPTQQHHLVLTSWVWVKCPSRWPRQNAVQGPSCPPSLSLAPPSLPTLPKPLPNPTLPNWPQPPPQACPTKSPPPAPLPYPTYPPDSARVRCLST